MTKLVRLFAVELVHSRVQVVNQGCLHFSYLFHTFWCYSFRRNTSIQPAHSCCCDDCNVGHVANLPSATWLMLQSSHRANLQTQHANLVSWIRPSVTWLMLWTLSTGSNTYSTVDPMVHDATDLCRRSSGRCVSVVLLLVVYRSTKSCTRGFR